MTQSQHRLWILEDEEDSQVIYRDVLGSRFDLKFFSTIAAFKNELGAARTQSALPQLLLADLRLPDGNFLDCFHEAHLLEGLMVVVVSSMDDIKTLKDCYAAGALDYLTKPFSKNEFLVKIERLLTTRVSGPYELDPIKHILRVRGKATPALTSKEFQMMSLFQSAPQGEVSRQEILEKIWGDVSVSSKTLDVHLFNLRKKISDAGLEIVFVQPASYQLRLKNEV